MSSSEEQKEKGNTSSSDERFSEELDNFPKRRNYNVYYAIAYLRTKRHYERHYPERWRKERLKTPKELQRYFEKAAASDGFDVRGCSGGRPLSGGIDEMDPSDLARMHPYAKFAVAQHIKDQKKKGINLELVFKEVVRANSQVGAMYYITLKARDNQDAGKLKIYRAKVWYHPHMVEEKKCGKSLMKFYEAPPEPEPPKKRKKKPETEMKQQKPRTTPKRPKLPFDIFVEDLRKSPKYESKRNCHVLGVAGNKWRSMSAEDKAKYEERATYAVGVQTRAAKRAKN